MQSCQGVEKVQIKDADYYNSRYHNLYTWLISIFTCLYASHMTALAAGI